MAVRTTAFTSVLRGANLYPDLGAVTFSQHGGDVTAETPVTMFTDADTIYYTLDGTDPRLLGGAVAADALSASFGGPGAGSMTFVETGHLWKYWDLGTDPGAAWRTPAFNDTSWQEGPSQLGYGSDNEGSGTELSFGPDPGQKYPATYFRTTVTIPDPTLYDHFLLRLKYDDAVGFYVNGTPAVLTSNLPDGANSAYDQYASSSIANENDWHDYTLPTNIFIPGVNTLSAQVHQSGGGSSDLRLDCVLRGEVTPVGGGANESDPLFFAANTVLTARSYNSATQQWSALNQALFTVGVVPPAPSNLVVSQLHYHPHEPVLPAESAISTDRDDYEFVELLNVGPATLDLSGVRFEEGITYTFPAFTFLPPGARILVVRHTAAFLERYGAGIGSTPIAGEYSGRLSNDGERLLLTGPLGTLRDFTYNDQLPWPTTPDGGGPSLVLIAPADVPDHAVGANWRPSTALGGLPGTADSLSFAAWMAARGIVDDEGDPDDDGLNNFGEFALGTAFDQHSANRFPALVPVAVGTDTHIAIDVRLSLAAMDDARMLVERSPDLATWSNASDEFTIVSHTAHDDGTLTVRLQSNNPVPTSLREFFRIGFESR